MFKDKNRQRQAVKLATRRYRQKLKGITGVPLAEAGSVIPSVIPSVIVKDKTAIQPAVPFHHIAKHTTALLPVVRIT